MNAIEYSVKQIRARIPEAVLVYGLTKNDPRGLEAFTSLDMRIMTNVIRGIVLPQLNINSQREVVIPLSGITPKIDIYNNSVWKIPEDRTAGLEIVYALGIGTTSLLPSAMHQGGIGVGTGIGEGYGSGRNGLGGCCAKGNYLTNQMQAVMDSYKPISMDYNVTAEVLAPNVILLKGSSFILNQQLALRCIVENDSNLNNIKPPSYDVIAKACVLACKAYIYNNRIIDIDTSVLQYGQELGRLTQIIEGYESAQDEYDEYISEVVRKTLFMNDHEAFSKFVLGMTHPT